MEVNIMCWAGPALLKADIDFAQSLENCFEYSCSDELKQFVKSALIKEYIGDFLELTIYEHLTVSKNMAKNLNVFDIISPKILECHSDGNKKIGKILIEFLVDSEYKFLLFKRQYTDVNEISLDFIALSNNSYIDDYLEIINGGMKGLNHHDYIKP